MGPVQVRSSRSGSLGYQSCEEGVKSLLQQRCMYRLGTSVVSGIGGCPLLLSGPTLKNLAGVRDDFQPSLIPEAVVNESVF